MFNAEKLLGGMLGNAMGKGKGLGSLGLGSSKAAVGMGVLGVAFAAFEHFVKTPRPGQPAVPPGQPPLPGRAVPLAPPPPPPGGGALQAGPTAPPPAPAFQTKAPSGLPSGQPSGPDQDTAILLIRAMIAAAHADGVLDDDERARIFQQLDNLGLSEEEHDFMERELHAPWNAAALAASASSPDVARQVYAASLLAIEVDTPEERSYLEELAGRLRLDESAVAAIHRELGL